MINILPGLCTDHSAIKIFSYAKRVQKGSQLLEIEQFLLEDDEFILQLTNILNDLLMDNAIKDEQVKFEWIKFKDTRWVVCMKHD